MRHDVRNFRLDRLDRLELLVRTFQRPTNFQLQVNRSNQDRKLIIKALFDHSIARWVREARSYYVLGEEECDDGLLVTLAVRQEREVFQWLLSWGSQVRVLEPVSLCEKLRAEAAKMLQIYQHID